MDINNKVEEIREELIKSTQEIVKIKSVQEDPKEGMPFGEGVNKALEFSLELCKSMGFKTTNLDGYIGYAELGEGEDYIAILGHLDVVPEGTGWIYPPYGGEIHDGKIFARGTTDDKGPLYAALYGLKALKELNIPLSKKVRVIFGTNEESGCGEMQYYRDREKPPIMGFTPDAEYPIIYAEKGITIFDVAKEINIPQEGDIIIKSIKGGERANMVPDNAEAIIIAKDKEEILKSLEGFVKSTGYDIKGEIKGNELVIKSFGFSAHGSLPHLGKNAIMQMIKFLVTLPLGESDIYDYLKLFNDYVGLETNGKSFGVGLEDKESGELSFNVGTIDMTEKKVLMKLNLRYPVTFKYEDMMEPFKEKLEGTNIKVENIMHHPPLYFPSDHPLIKTLQKVYKEQTGDEPRLLAIGGGTYAKEMKNIVAFGPIFPGKPDLDHQANEYIEVEDLIRNAKIYAHAIYELAK